MKNALAKNLIRLSAFGLLFGAISALAISKSNAFTVDATVGNYSFDLEEYYEPLTAKGGTALLGQVHDLMVTTHKTYTSYDDCKSTNYVYQTDPGDDDTHVRDFYTQAGSTLARTWNGNNAGTWNREHVWPQSSSNGMWGKTGAGGDIHHIRPEEVRLNGERGNNNFGEVANRENYKVYAKDKNSKPITDYVGGYLNGGIFEPIDSCKGDVARIILYVYVHYNKASYVGGTTDGNGASYCGNIPITNVITASSNTADGCFDMLARWSSEDPVDEIETTRNEAASRMTGTRNVFIDHPELIDCIWGEGEWGGGSSQGSSSESSSSQESSSSEESSSSSEEAYSSSEESYTSEESSSEESISSEESVSSEESSEEQFSSEERSSSEESISSEQQSSESHESSSSSTSSSSEESRPQTSEGSEPQSSERSSVSSTESSSSQSTSSSTIVIVVQGCGGSIAAGGAAVALTLTASVVLIIKRKKK